MDNRIVHPVSPVFDEKSRILILGTFPSVKSREGEFFYHHPQNRFWRVISAVCGEEVPETIDEKKKLLLRNHIAVWDVVHSCEITGSADSSIRNVIPNDIHPILEQADIRRIYANGGRAYDLYKRYIYQHTGREILQLPSTSPANAAFSLERLIEIWSSIRQEDEN